MIHRRRRSTFLVLILILAQLACLSSADPGEAPKGGTTPAAGAAVAQPLVQPTQPGAARRAHPAPGAISHPTPG